ncbi:MAG: DUF2784 family protein [Oligoflexales bacterium]
MDQRSRNNSFWARRRLRRRYVKQPQWVIGAHSQGYGEVIRLFADKEESQGRGILVRAFLKLADIAMHIIHCGLILFSMVGYLWEETRALHLFSQFMIFTSWYGLGRFFYPGYCILTDLHWRLKTVRGCRPEAEYYTKYMVDKVCGTDASRKLLDTVSHVILFSAITISVIWNVYDWWFSA